MRLITTALSVITLLTSAPSIAADITIPYEKFQLTNGLTVVVHEDRKAPVVAVSIWYHVGSKDEPVGKTGFAHLFEHLMFGGSENVPEWDTPLEEAGQTDANGTTWFDRTNYFQTVPTPALDRVLFMESDRMGHLLGAITQEKLDNQRSVVQNEKRQGDNQPYGRSEYAVLAGLLPEGHPYSHSTIGSLADLDAASLEDVKAWFNEYYGAANTVLVLAGDIDGETARPLVEKYFGDIESGPPLTQTKSNAPQLAVNKHEVMYDHVPQPRLDRNWVAPGRISKDTIYLSLAADILGGGKTSRLYQKLVNDLQMATSASASMQSQEILSFYSVTINTGKDADLQKVQREMEAVIDKFLAKGPTSSELARSKTSIKAGVIRGLEKVGGFGGKAVELAEGELYANDPGFILKQLDWLEAATAKDILRTAREVMNAGYYQLDILPYEDYSSAPSLVDRTAGIPGIETSPELTFPAVVEASLSNGMKIVLAERHAVPVVEISIQFDAGYAADATEGGKLGVASFTGAMLDEGTSRRSALDIAEALEGLGATMGAGSNLDTTGLSMSALKENIGASLDILSDVLQNPAFEQSEIDKLRKRWLAAIEQEKASPVQLALRLLPPELYGDDHAYGVPFTGSGTEKSITSLTQADLQNFHATWLRPDNGTIFVVGDTNLVEIIPLLENALGSWRGTAAAIPTKNIASVSLPEKARVIIVDKPGSLQSLILAGHLAAPSNVPNNVAISAMNDVLGGQFSARVNMNLREDKGWAYGAYTFFRGARGQRPWLVYAPVQTDKTKESIAELIKEMNDFKSTRPATPAEIERVILSNTRSLPGAFETADDVLGSLVSSARYGRAWDYPETLTERYQALDVDDIKDAAAEVIHPESLIWLIVGDRDKIEVDIRDLNIGEIEIRNLSDL